MDLFWQIITSVDPKFLKLCPMDDEIYLHFRSKFSDMEIGTLDEPDLKSPGAKEVRFINLIMQINICWLPCF